MTWSGLLFLGLAVLFALYPRAVAYPLVALLTWLAGSLLVQGFRLYWQRRSRRKELVDKSR
jgi:hypothetical protein